MAAPVFYTRRGAAVAAYAAAMTGLEHGVAVPTAEEYRPAVTRGAEFLTRVLNGPEWRGDIDAQRLSIARADLCVLGQLFGSYGAGLVALGLSWDQARICGFQLALRHRETSLVVPSYTALDEAWRRELAA